MNHFMNGFADEMTKVAVSTKLIRRKAWKRGFFKGKSLRDEFRRLDTRTQGRRDSARERMYNVSEGKQAALKAELERDLRAMGKKTPDNADAIMARKRKFWADDDAAGIDFDKYDKNVESIHGAQNAIIDGMYDGASARGRLNNAVATAAVPVAGLAITGAALKASSMRKKKLTLREKTAAFPQHEQGSAPYDSASSVGATMQKTQGKGAASGLKGSQVQPALGQSKRAPTPMTTPNYMVNG